MVTFNATGTVQSPTQLQVTTRQFTLTIDEPPSLGGEDHGANPVEYVLAALLGCLNVVIHTVAAEQGITVHSLELSADGELDPAGFLGQDDSVRPGYQGISVHVAIDADADPDTIRSMVDLAKQRCPVSDNLAHPTPVSVETAVRGA
ncbi:MAG: OsmC family protein [Brachybacterium sp.]|nr:OsmC family protein [Brachybacterium sp.]